MNKKAFHIRVTGLVQGVGFRAFVKARADEMGISGWVRNQPDDSVLIFSVLSEELSDQWISAVKAGPPRSRVDGVEILEADFLEGPDSREFRIARSQD